METETKTTKKRKRRRALQRRRLWLSLCVLLLLLLYALGKRYIFPEVQQNVAGETTASKEDTWFAPVVTIQQIQMGEGKDRITCFVSDIQLSDAADLRTGFAKNQYGLNIKETLTAMAGEHGASFAVNGDFYGCRRDGIVLRNGILYRDEPTERECLVMYRDGTAETMRERDVTGEELVKRGAWNVFSFGPVLVEDGVIREGLSEPYWVDLFTESISGKHPRTGIGIIGKNHYLIITVDGRAEGYSCGMTFREFAQLFADYGCEIAYNLDGGSSVTLYQDGVILNRPSSGKEREISDILYISGQKEEQYESDY